MRGDDVRQVALARCDEPALGAKRREGRGKRQAAGDTVGGGFVTVAGAHERITAPRGSRTPGRGTNGGGEGSRTPVPDNNPGRDYMLSRNLISAAGTPSDTLPRRLAGMKNLGLPRAVPASTHACCCVPPAQQVSAGERHGTLGRESQLLVSSFV